MEENMSQKEMLERIAELDYNKSQLRDLNDEMRQWLEVADDDMAALRSENATLRKQLKVMEEIISEAQQVEAEPYGYLMASDLNENRSSEKNIQDQEMESTMLKEENKKLTTKMKNLEEEIDQEKITLSKLRAAFQSLEDEMEEAQLELQHKQEVIHQKNLEVDHLKETVEEYNNIIKDLRLMKQELTQQLEDRRDEASFAVLTEVMREEEESVSVHLSLAEEIQMLVSAEMKTSMLPTTHLTPVTTEEEEHEGADAEELLESQSLTENCKTKSGSLSSSRFACTLETAIYGARLFMQCIFTFSFIVLIVLGCCAGDLLSISTLRSSARLMLQPYFSLHYDALPPI
ncbi:kinectin [Austrofundulus limnaeus]|uniref:Kinectin-like n=1 Tax=Austrofundulus limnaeus TaxID=52670 RepID=A0A2I4B1S8_AUSLI|nr:PREDICTED: kinectin-like [Austrofundulus limnaeus]XP_013861689.1 PREDICTED: kinectin-like [Austrofundulus limnaeus]